MNPGNGWDPWRPYRWKSNANDRRKWWASPIRDGMVYEYLTRGERKVRGLFCDLMRKKGFSPEKAAWQALGLFIGPIPELETREDFEAYWAKVIPDLAKRWEKHKSTRSYRGEGRRTLLIKKTEDFMSREAMAVAEKLASEALDPNNEPGDRIRAQLGFLKVVHAGKSKKPKPGPPIVLPENFRENHATIVPKLFEQCAADPDVNRGRLRQDGLRWMLSKAMPEVYGDKMDINVQSNLDVVTVLANVRKRRAVAEEKLRAQIVDANAPPLSLEDILGGDE